MGLEQHDGVAAAGLGRAVIDARVVAGKHLVGHVYAHGHHAGRKAVEAVEGIPRTARPFGKADVFAGAQVFDDGVFKALYGRALRRLLCAGNAACRLIHVRLIRGYYGQVLGSLARRVQLALHKLAHGAGREYGRGKRRDAAKLAGPQVLVNVQHLVRRHAGHVRAVAVVHDVIGQLFPGEPVVFHTGKMPYALRIPTAAQFREAVRLYGHERKRRHTAMRPTAERKKTFPAFHDLAAQKLLKLIEVQTSGNIGILFHPGAEPVLYAAARLIGGRAVGMHGQRLETGPAAHHVGGINIHAAGKERKVAHQVAHAGPKARGSPAYEPVDLFVDRVPLVRLRKGSSVVAPASEQRTGATHAPFSYALKHAHAQALPALPAQVRPT